MASPKKLRLGDALISQGLINDEQLKAALDLQRKTGKKLGRAVIDMGLATENQVAMAMATQLGMAFVDLDQYDINVEVARGLSESQARRFRAVLLTREDQLAIVAMSDPSDLLAFDELTRILKIEPLLSVATESALLQAFDRVYKRGAQISGLAQELKQELGEREVDLGALTAASSVEDAPVVRLLRSIFESALASNASDIHIEPQERTLQIRFRVDGTLHVQSQSDPKIAGALVLRLKLVAGLDISEKRLPQDGRFAMKVGGQHVDVRISTLPTQYGESAVMRLLNQSGGTSRLDQLGMPAGMLDKIRGALTRSSGMILVTGPTGSGKTTTLYAALQELNTPQRKIITVEDPVEYRIPGLNQVQVLEKIDLSFARVLRSVLRQDPDVILVGEMRDQGTVETGLRAAMTGHMVLSTLHTNDATSTPIRLLNMGAPAYMVAMSLQLVLAQRLVRLICVECKTDHTLTAQEREWLSEEIGEQVDRFKLYRGRGCERCSGTGYKGRTGVYELLEMTKPLVHATSSGDPKAFMAAAQEQMQGHTLRRHSAQLALLGRTSVQEAMSVSAQMEE